MLTVNILAMHMQLVPTLHMYKLGLTFVSIIGTVWGQGGSHSASHGARDVISVLTITKEPTRVIISVGDRSEEHTRHWGHVNFFQVEVGTSSGPVTLEMHGKSAQGPAISSECPPCGHVHFNCAAIEVRHRHNVEDQIV